MIDLKEDNNNLKNIKKKYTKKDFEDEIRKIEIDFDKKTYKKEILEIKNSFNELKDISKKMEFFLDDKQHINEIDNKLIENKIDNKKKIIILLIILYILCSIIYKNKNNILNKFDKQIGGTEQLLSVKEQVLDNLPFTGKLMPIFICCIIILLGILYLKKRKLKIICNCDNGSWWYSCVEGSGYGSPTCDVYHKFMDALEFLGKRVIELFNKIVWFRNIIKNAIMKSFRLITNSTSVVLSKIPTLPNLGSVIDNLFGSLSINCGFKIPVINKYFNPCSGLSAAWRGAGQALKTIFEKIGYLLEEVFKKMMYGITKSFDVIKIVIRNIIKYALYPIFLIMKSLKFLMKKFMSLIQAILDIGIFKIIVFQVASTIAQVTGIKDIGKVLGTAIVCVFTVIFMPIIGGLFIIISFIMSIISSIFSFIFGIFQSIFMFFFML